METPPDNIRDVFYEVIRHFVWRPDDETFGRREHWDRPVKRGDFLYGDCDDFSLECYYRLLEFGYQPHIAVCLTEVGQRKWSAGIDHAVCICDGWVLDNRQRHPTPLIDMTHYTNWSRSDGTLDGFWVNFELVTGE